MGSLDYINSKFMPKNYKNKEEVNKEYVDLVRSVLLNYGFPTDNFDKNVEGLEVTLSTDKNAVGQYMKDFNKLVYTDKSSYIHELFHVSSADRTKTPIIGTSTGIRVVREGYRDKYTMIGLDEGITDYLTVLSGNEPNGYGLSRLCAELLVETNGIQILKPYFENDGKKFFKQLSANFMKIIVLLDNYYYSLDELTNFRGNMFSEKYFAILDNIEKNLLSVIVTMSNYFTNENFDAKKYISEKINAGYLNRELSILGVESINELYPKGLK